MEGIRNTENTVIIYTDYKEYKAELDAELEKSAESFIRIGYLLKVARDTGILKESGYGNVNEFAQKEYGLDKTQVSRFIRINDRFSQDGYAETLKEEYKGFGYAKLAIMLQLPDSLNEELSPAYSKIEIQTIKEEYDAEEKISDIEVMMEKKDEVQQSLDDTLKKVVYQIGKEDSDLYVTLWESMIKKEGEKKFIEHLAPSGTKTYSVRIPGTGRMMLMMKEAEEEVKLINVRDASDKRIYKKTDLVEAFRSIFIEGDVKASWESTYGETFPEKKEEVAPVQQVQKKESKVVKAKPAEKRNAMGKKPEIKTEKNQPAAVKEIQEMTLHDIEKDIPQPAPIEESEKEIQCVAVTGEDEKKQCAGQSDISDFPEYMPEPEESAKPLRLQKRAYELIKMSLLTSIDIWKERVMPLEAVRKNKENAKKLVKVFEELEEAVKIADTE